MLAALAVLSAAGMVAATPVHAQGPGTPAFPAKPVRMLIPSPPGGGTDTLGRIVKEGLGAQWSQPIVVDNRGGASGLLAAEILARAAPDGYTLGVTTLTQLVATLVYQRLQIHKEFVPVSRVGSTPFLIVASPHLPVKTIPELIAYAKGRPGQVLYASGGQGSVGHLCIELFKSMTGAGLTHVPYKNSINAVTELAGGQVHVLCSAVPTLHATLQNAKARALGVASRHPSKLAPGMPAITASVPGFEMDGWFGVVAPLNTPAAIVTQLNAAMTQVLNLPEIQERLLAVGVEARISTPAELGAFIKSEAERWMPVIRNAGIKAE